MTKQHQNFSLKRGDTRELEIPIVDEDGNPLDLTGAQEIKWAMFDSVDGVDTVKILKLLSLFEVSLIQIDGAGAVLDGIKVDISPADSEPLDPGNYQHEIQVTELDGSVFTPTEGLVFLGKDLITGSTVAPGSPPGAGASDFFVEDGDANIIALKNGSNVQALRVYRNAAEPSYWAAAWNAVSGFFSAITGDYDYNLFAGQPNGKLNIWLGGVIQWVFDGITLEPKGGAGIGTDTNRLGQVLLKGWVFDADPNSIGGSRQGTNIGPISGAGNNLAPNRNVFRLSGLAGAQALTMTPPVSGQSAVVTILFDDSNVTMIDSGAAGAANTFNLAGNFVSSPDASLTLVYVGTPSSGNARWLEIARSSN